MCNSTVHTSEELAAFEIAEDLHEYLIETHGDVPDRVWFLALNKLTAFLTRNKRILPQVNNDSS